MKRNIVMKIGGLVTALGLTASMLSVFNMSSSATISSGKYLGAYNDLSSYTNRKEKGLSEDKGTYNGTLYFGKGKYGYNLYVDKDLTKEYTEQEGEWRVEGNKLILNGFSVNGENGVGLEIRKNALICTEENSENYIAGSTAIKVCDDEEEKNLYCETEDKTSIEFDGDGELYLYGQSFGVTADEVEVNGGGVEVFAVNVAEEEQTATTAAAVSAEKVTLNGGIFCTRAVASACIGIDADDFIEINGGEHDVEVKATDSYTNNWTYYSSKKDGFDYLSTGVETNRFILNDGTLFVECRDNNTDKSMYEGIAITKSSDNVESKNSGLIVNGGELGLYYRSSINKKCLDARLINRRQNVNGFDVKPTTINGGYVCFKFEHDALYSQDGNANNNAFYNDAPVFNGGVTFFHTEWKYGNRLCGNCAEPKLGFGMKAFDGYAYSGSNYESKEAPYNKETGNYVYKNTNEFSYSTTIKRDSNSTFPIITNQSSYSNRYVTNNEIKLFVDTKYDGEAHLTYKWEKDGKIITDENKSTLTMTANEDAVGTYKCYVTDADCHVFESDVMKVAVDQPLKIAKRSGSGTFNKNDDVKLSVTPKGGTGIYTYQWSKYQNGKFVSELGATETGEYTMKFDGEAQVIRCTITDGWNRKTKADFTINPQQQVVNNAPAELTISSTESQSLNSGDNTSIAVTAQGGVAPYTYNWTKNGYAVEGGNTDKLSFVATDATGGTYKCTVTDANGKTVASNEIKVDVIKNLSVSSQSGNVECDKGSETTLHVQATGGRAPYTYQWTKNGVAVEGATEKELSIVVDDNTVGTYKCDIRDFCGRTASSSNISVSKKAQPAKPVAELRRLVGNNSNAIGQQITVKNGGETEVDLSKVEARYYFSSDSVDGAYYHTALVNGIGMNYNNIKGEVVKMANPTDTADSYVKITYLTDGKLVSANDYVQTIFFIMSPTADTTFNPTNDYSYINNDIAVFYDGKLVSGSKPQ